MLHGGMQSVVIRRPGGYERLEIIEQPDPNPGPGQILVSVRAVGVNYADVIVRMGLYSSAKKYVGWPITPGFDTAGVVRAVGPGVSRAHVGDRVIAVTRFGAYQSEIVVPEDQVFAMPADWSFSRAAAFPTVHLTAYYALCELGRPRPGMKVLVHTAAGGVGTAALRICSHLDLETMAVVGTEEKVPVAKEAGATHVVARSSGDYWKTIEELVPEGFDMVLEASGVSTLGQSYRHLRPTGRMMVFGMGTLLPSEGRRVNWLKLAYNWLKLPRYNPLGLLDDNKTVAGFNLSYLFEEKDRLDEAMRQLLEWAQQGALPAPPITEYPLSEVKKAHADLESGQTVGKLVLLPR